MTFGARLRTVHTNAAARYATSSRSLSLAQNIWHVFRQPILKKVDIIWLVLRENFFFANVCCASSLTIVRKSWTGSNEIRGRSQMFL